MQREIKFKCWEYFKKEMLEMDTIDLRAYEKYSDEYVLLQFTGLKDKNGVEIYEGDIIKITRYLNNEPEEPKICSIIFDQHTLSYSWRESWHYDQYYNLAECFQLTKNKGQTAGYLDFEVLGNIHQNPELLQS